MWNFWAGPCLTRATGVCQTLQEPSIDVHVQRFIIKRLRQRIPDSRGLHPSASPHPPPCRPPPPSLRLWHVVQRRKERGETAEEEGERADPETDTSHSTARARHIGELWFGHKSSTSEMTRKGRRATFLVAELTSARNIWCPWTHLLYEDFALICHLVLLMVPRRCAHCT